MTVRLVVDKFDKEFIPPEDSRPAAVRVRVIVNGLVAGKCTWPIDGWDAKTEAEAEALATAEALRKAEHRVSQWRRGIHQWATRAEDTP